MSSELTPTHQHKKGGLYRFVAQVQPTTTPIYECWLHILVQHTETTEWIAVVPLLTAWISPDITEDHVLYQGSNGVLHLRPASMFYEKDRFRPLGDHECDARPSATLSEKPSA